MAIQKPAVTQALLTKSEYTRPGTKRSRTTKIAVHYTGNRGSRAISNRNYFEGLSVSHKTYASSHYIVGLQGEIIQCIPDEEIAWTTNSANSYSIGIECCFENADGTFNKATRDSLIKLVAYLLDKYGLTSSDIIRHYDITGKACPICWCANSGAKYTDYNVFRNEVYTYMNGKAFVPVSGDDGVADPELAAAVSSIIKANIHINYNDWKRIGLIKLENVPALLSKLGGIDYLVDNGVISDRTTWDNKKYTKDNVKSLILKYVAKIINKPKE